MAGASAVVSGVSAVSEVVDLSGIALEVATRLRKGVPSKFLQKSIGEDKSDHSFSGDGAGGHDAPVGALVGRLNRILGDHVCGAERAAKRRDRFQVAADDNVLAVADASFEAAGAV